LSSEKRGQHLTKVPVTALGTHTLAEMVQPLLIALPHDDVSDVTELLPTAERLLLK
jgi:hypothetical protein